MEVQAGVQTPRNQSTRLVERWYGFWQVASSSTRGESFASVLDDNNVNVFHRCPVRKTAGHERRAGGTDRRVRRHPHLWARRAEFRGVRAGSCAHAADSAGGGGDCLHLADQRQHHYPAGDRLFFLSADNRSVPVGRRILHCGAREPGGVSWPVGGRCADDRLRPGGGGWYLSGRGSPGISRSQPRTAHASEYVWAFWW